MQGMYEIRTYQLEAGYSTMGTVVDLLARGCVPHFNTCIFVCQNHILSLLVVARLVAHNCGYLSSV